MSLDDLVRKLDKNREFAVTLANDSDSACVVNTWISTGCLALDAILGGGLPIGRIVEIYGDASTGKTLIAQMAVRQAIDDGIIVIYIDTERALSLDLMVQLGIDPNKLILSSPDTMEECFELMVDIIDSSSKDDKILIVWDSIAATTVEQEKDAVFGKATMGRHAQIMSQSLRKLNPIISKNHVSLLCVNQTRQKIGVLFGDDEATFGGKALSFYSSIRIRLKKGKKIAEGKGKRPIGIMGHANIVKNKVAMPFREADLPIYFGEGVDDSEASYLYLKTTDDIKVNGGWSSINIDGKDIKFQAATWYDKVYDPHYNAIADMIEGSN